MPDYRRNRFQARPYFFTVKLLDRRSNLLVANIDALSDSVRRVRARAPYSHRRLGRPRRPHALSVDVAARRCRFSGSVASDQDRIREIAADRRAAVTGHDAPRRTRHLAAAVLGANDPRDDRDFAAHMDYTHFNPVKHGLVARPADWPYSSFRRCVASGMYPADWRGGSDEPQQTGERQ
jgi:putative transposase